MKLLDRYKRQQMAEARANYELRHDIVTVQMRVPRSERDTWKAAASARGLSFTAYVRKLIEEDAK